MQAIIAMDPPKSRTPRRAPGRSLADLAHENRVAAMGHLSAAIAHEVKQPIAASMIEAGAALRWLAANPPNLDEVRLALLRIVENGNRGNAVIGRVRALIEKAPPSRERLDINEAIREVVALTRGEAVKNDISLRLQLADDLPLIQGDRVQLQQVMLNLVVNAIEAMSGGGALRELGVSTAKDGPSGVLVAVRDTGPGMPPSAVKRVFDPFYTTKPGGLGMGLSICRSIIDAHGGKLSAAPNEPRGTVFQFTLP